MALHFVALQPLYLYLRDTPREGIYYWRRTPRLDLLIGPHPTTKDPNKYIPETRTQLHHTCTRVTIYSDYANDTSRKRSVSGISIKIAGGAVFYKTKFQSTVALSSTEAEFIAACEAAKGILYIRFILNDVNIQQDEATTLYEDNQGALLMATYGHSTKQTHHMDTKHFALQ